MSDNKGRLAYLRKYMQTPMDAELVKEMIADGLNDEQIMEALGVPGAESRMVQPDEHSFGTSVPTDEEERALEPQKGENPQPKRPGESVSEDSSGDSGGEQEDPLVHVAGLINHLVGSKKKSK